MVFIAIPAVLSVLLFLSASNIVSSLVRQSKINRQSSTLQTNETQE
jgi:hypothetical protein